jgi:hypothetical protein
MYSSIYRYPGVCPTAAAVRQSSSKLEKMEKMLVQYFPENVEKVLL